MRTLFTAKALRRWLTVGCVVLLLGSVNSTTNAQVSFSLQGPFPSGPQSDFRTDFVAVGDIDEDKVPDLVVTNYGPENGPGNTSVLWGEGAGSFSAPQALGNGNCPNGVALGDLDRDRHIDVVIANQCAGMVTIFWGSGTRTPRARQDLTIGNSAVPVGIADFDGDGNLDIVTTDQTTNTAWVFYNERRGNFTSRAFSTCAGPTLAAIGKLDNQAGPDLFITSFWSSVLCFFYNDGAGSFSTPNTQPAGSFPTTPGIIGDFTGDKLPDVAFARRGCFSAQPCSEQDRQPDGLAIYAGDGNGGFSEWGVVDVGLQPIGAAQGDLNADGRSDVVVPNNESQSVSILLGQAGGGLTVVTEIFGLSIPNHAAIADVNNDRRPDILVANWGTATVSVFLNTTPRKGGR